MERDLDRACLVVDDDLAAHDLGEGIALVGEGGEHALVLAMVCLVAIFVPSFLLVIGVLPYWETLRQQQATQHALMGVNAAVVGLLLAACYQPVWTSAILRPQDFCLGLLALLALMFWKWSPWLVVCLGSVFGAVMAALV